MKNLRIMVDVSVTVLHHGHIRLFKQAKEYGNVIAALTIDEEIKYHKGYVPELSFAYRKEILESIKYIDEVVPAPWLITENLLKKHKIDYLLHGDDNQNLVDESKIIIIKKTKNISSSIIRNQIIKNHANQF